MPEETNRLVTDRISSLLLASSADAVDNLRDEGYSSDTIELVGNVMIDTLLATLGRVDDSPILDRHGLERDAYALLTLHRPANVDDPSVLMPMLESLRPLASTHRIIWPIHPRVRVAAEHLVDWIELIDPVGYVDSLALQRSARIVLTDSGGIQEETTVLGTPCLTLRESTERPITVTEGTNRLVGVVPSAIRSAVADELGHRTPARRPALWDGEAGRRVVDAILSR